MLRALLAASLFLGGCVTAHADQPSSAGLLTAAQGDLPGFFGCLRDHKIAIIGAHRGGPLAEHPENALRTFEFTTSLAPVFLEADVQQTADGVLFMNHDNHLDRNTTGEGLVSETDWKEIADLKQRDPTMQPVDVTPPLLSDVLDWADGKALLMLDTKPSTVPAKVLKVVDDAKARDRVFYLAYTIDQALGYRAIDPDAILAMPIFDDSYFDAAEAAGLLNDKLVAMVRVANVAPDFVEKVAATGATIMSGTYGRPQAPDAVYRTLKDAGAYDEMVGLGAQLLVSNRPRSAAEALLSHADYASKLKVCGVGS
ncbi:MAG: hypothetical protein CMK09_17590 [Ponticaulis sp.]|nr:hypothetical protein [Ponticaulis sp.]|tara:strand:+ start:26392 stop:27327 length:936 start_codon:yes stop_codon:yes gene_type:complete